MDYLSCVKCYTIDYPEKQFVYYKSLENFRRTGITLTYNKVTSFTLWPLLFWSLSSSTSSSSNLRFNFFTLGVYPETTK